MWAEALVLVTLLAAFAVFLAPNRVAGRLSFLLSGLPLLGSFWMWNRYDATGNVLVDGRAAFETQIQWLTLGPYDISWHTGLDGVSMPLLILTTVLFTLAIVSAWTPIDERQSQFYGLMLLMEASLIGVFTQLDFFIWFVFWEGVLIPMYFLIAIWGGPRRKYAAIKFFVYTNVASLVMFIGFIALVFGLGDAISSLDLPEIAMALREGQPNALWWIGPQVLKLAAFSAMFAGFAVKVPVVPFHTWLPDAHVEAPTPVSVILAGVLLKMGTYALLRFNFTMLSDVAQANAGLIAIFAVVSVVYGAMLALSQQDLKRIVAYSSISSMGYVILGLVAYTTYGVGGATFQMISHGLLSGLLFMTVGVMYNATHTRMVGDLSGLADRMPVTVAVFVAGAFGYMGLPLMSGFAGELFVFLGSFGAFPGSVVYTAVAMFGIVIVAGYLLYAMQRTLFGEYRVEGDHEATPAPAHDVIPLLVLILAIVWLGVDPGVFFGMIQEAVNPVVAVAGGGV